MTNFNFLIGKPLAEAKDYANSSGFSVRVIDMGFPAVLTCDYSANRLNFKVKEGKVVDIELG